MQAAIEYHSSIFHVYVTELSSMCGSCTLQHAASTRTELPSGVGQNQVVRKHEYQMVAGQSQVLQFLEKE